MKGYLFPGQASQFEGMGLDMYESSAIAKRFFDEADAALGFKITDVMFTGSVEDLTQTKVTQPAVFLHSVIKVKMNESEFKPAAVAGHSLGEFSALVAAGVLSFEQGLALVQKRAMAMQTACELAESTMAAILGLEDNIVEEICSEITEVVPANYNCPGQLVISGSMAGIDEAVKKCTDAGARRAIVLAVGGGFHSPFMEPARKDLEEAIEKTVFGDPICPIYQNVDAKPTSDPIRIKENLIAQLTSPVRWTQTLENMMADGIETFIEVGGNGKTLQGFVKKINRQFPTSAL